jgi:DNA-binding GntR family transcriptional regulator
MPGTKVNLRLKSSFAGTIYDHVKKLIIEGELKPDQRITVQEYAKYFNVSITPVREAFQRLMAENYLSSNNANRNELRVLSMTGKEVNDIYEFIRALDIHGIRTNLSKITDPVIAELAKKHEAMAGFYEKNQLKSFFRENFEIHSVIWKATQNDFIYQTMVKATDKLTIFIRLYPEHFYSDDVLAKSYREHVELLDALRRKDAAKLENLLEQHWAEGYFPFADTDNGKNPREAAAAVAAPSKKI